MLQPRMPQDVLIVVSDGGDNTSRLKEGNLKQDLKLSSARVFAVAFLDSPRYPKEAQGAIQLSSLAEETGGLPITLNYTTPLELGQVLANKPEMITQAVDQIAAAIAALASNSYAITFNRQSSRKPEKLRIKPRQDNLTLLYPRSIPPCDGY